MYANEIGFQMPYFVCARDGAGLLVLKRETREAAEKKAAELRDLRCFDVEVVEKDDPQADQQAA